MPAPDIHYGAAAAPPAEAPPKDDYDKYSAEWQKCRETADKFDGNLVDMRKYGFTILTGLTTAGSFLGFSAAARPIQIGVIVVTMALIMVLYWLDIYYQSLLFGSAFRARFLELFRLRRYRGLTIYLNSFYSASHTGGLLHFLYGGFLAGLFILGLFVSGFLPNFGGTPLSRETLNTFWVLTGAFLFISLGMATIYVVCDPSRRSGVKEVSDYIRLIYTKSYTGDERMAAAVDDEIIRYFIQKGYL